MRGNISKDSVSGYNVLELMESYPIFPTIYVHFDSIHYVRIVSLNLAYFRLILLSSAIAIDQQVFAIGCKSKRLTIQMQGIDSK